MSCSSIEYHLPVPGWLNKPTEVSLLYHPCIACSCIYIIIQKCQTQHEHYNAIFIKLDKYDLSAHGPHFVESRSTSRIVDSKV